MKVIIPDLVSLDTTLKRIRGFYLSENLNFYQPVGEPSRFNYSVKIQERIDLPKQYSFRNGYYYKSGVKWYYERKIFRKIKLAFSYDLKTKEFILNRSFLHVPFEIGGILPFGRHLSDLINLDLFLQDYVIFWGCGIKLNHKTVGIIAPSFNGKTSFIKYCLENEAKYISEDVLIINFLENKIYGSGPRFNNFGRSINRKFIGQLTSQNVVSEAKSLDKLLLVTNTTDESKKVSNDKDLFEFMLLNSLLFLNNPFIRSYIFEEGLTQKVFEKIESYRTAGFVSKYVNIRNFEFDKLIKSL